MSGVTIFGMFPVPGAPSLLGGEAEDIHEIGSKVAMVLIILHVLAALKHQFISRDGLMARMSPH
jgi:cytochrome b561